MTTQTDRDLAAALRAAAPKHRIAGSLIKLANMLAPEPLPEPKHPDANTPMGTRVRFRWGFEMHGYQDGLWIGIDHNCADTVWDVAELDVVYPGDVILADET